MPISTSTYYDTLDELPPIEQYLAGKIPISELSPEDIKTIILMGKS